MERTQVRFEVTEGNKWRICNVVSVDEGKDYQGLQLSGITCGLGSRCSSEPLIWSTRTSTSGPLWKSC